VPGVAALFLDGFERPGLGKILRGWEVVRLPELIDVNPTRSLKRCQTAPYLEMKNMPEHSVKVLNWYNRKFGSGMKFVNGDSLLLRICYERPGMLSGLIRRGSDPLPRIPAPACALKSRSGKRRNCVFQIALRD